MTFTTERLILRPWRASDAEALFELAKDPRVGPMAGWPMHTSVDNSRDIIRSVLAVDDTYAVTLQGDDSAIGSIGLMIGSTSGLATSDTEAEIGYWLGVPHWGKGYIPEATRELMRHAIEDKGMTTLWCGYYEGNSKSLRVQEKCGFAYHHTIYDKDCPLLGERRTEHVTCMTKEQWLAG